MGGAHPFTSGFTFLTPFVSAPFGIDYEMHLPAIDIASPIKTGSYYRHLSNCLICLKDEIKAQINRAIIENQSGKT